MALLYRLIGQVHGLGDFLDGHAAVVFHADQIQVLRGEGVKGCLQIDFCDHLFLKTMRIRQFFGRLHLYFLRAVSLHSVDLYLTIPCLVSADFTKAVHCLVAGNGDKQSGR